MTWTLQESAIELLKLAREQLDSNGELLGGAGVGGGGSRVRGGQHLSGDKAVEARVRGGQLLRAQFKSVSVSASLICMSHGCNHCPI